MALARSSHDSATLSSNVRSMRERLIGFGILTALIFSAFMPLAVIRLNGGEAGVSGIGSEGGDGWLVVGAALVGVVVLAFMRPVWTTPIGLITLLVYVVDAANIMTHTPASYEYAYRLGMGMALGLMASLALVIFGLWGPMLSSVAERWDRADGAEGGDWLANSRQPFRLTQSSPEHAAIDREAGMDHNDGEILLDPYEDDDDEDEDLWHDDDEHALGDDPWAAPLSEDPWMTPPTRHSEPPS